MKSKTLIYLADLTHMASVISAEIFPFAVGLIGAKLIESLPDEVEIEIFKFPNNLTNALEEQTPHIIGFSNYSWNVNISYNYAKKIKEKFPNTVVVFGGPNYGVTDEETEEFWELYPNIDFYVAKEGELAMVELVKQLIAFDFDLNALKNSGTYLPNCHYIEDGKVVMGEIMPRIKNLEDLPSPYLMGLLDKFFEYNLIPLTHTTRGCPFKCTFCSEGALYYQKVAQRYNLAEELEYIAQRAKNTPILYLSDANFGMYKQDIPKAKAIAHIQDKYGYPKTLLVPTGKNQKERVVEVANILNGAMYISTALQSTNSEVLKNVERSNISSEALKGVAKEAKYAGNNTYTELILALPGDTAEAHKKSLKDTVESGQGVVRMYQLIMLRESKMNTPESRKKFGIKTKFRVMPRSYGEYQVYGESFISVEHEEICVENNTMTFEEYLDCREMDMTIEILHNGGTFLDLWYLCDWLGYSWFDLLKTFHEQRRNRSPELKNLYDEFRRSNIDDYWLSIQELEEYVRRDFNEFVSNAEGSNEMSKAKTIAFFYLQEELLEILTEEMKSVMIMNNCWDETMALYLQELKKFNGLQKMDVLEATHQYYEKFNFDFLSLSNIKSGVDPRKYKLDQPIEYHFFLDETQKTIFESHTKFYGKKSINALGKLLMRSRMSDIYRKVKPVEIETTISIPSLEPNILTKEV